MRRSILTPVTLTSIALCLPVLASAGDAWRLLSAIEIEESETNGVWKVEKHFPAALTDQDSTFTISGFAIPIVAQPYIETFLLVQDPADCPFCGDGGYGPSLEVTLKHPIDTLEEGTAVTVSGQLVLDHSPETYQAARLQAARLLDASDQP